MRALLLAALLSSPAVALNLPPRPDHGRVYDGAGVLTSAGVSQLQAVSDDLERRTGAELSVAVVQSLDGDDVADFTNRLFKAWGVGKKDKNNGILILLAPNERKARIEVGYGLEATLPDALAGRVLKDEVHPLFHDGRWQDGLLLAARRCAQLAAGEPGAAPPPKPRPGSDFPLVIAVPFFSLFMLVGGGATGSALARRGVEGGIWGLFGGLFSLIPGILAWLTLGGAGLPFGAVIFVWAAACLYAYRNPATLKGSGRGGSGGGWSSGDSGGGSWSSGDSGSSGGGGFGGGDSGGGGASDSF